MCTANCEGFYGTPSAQIFMCTATKIYVYIRSSHPYLLHWYNSRRWIGFTTLLTVVHPVLQEEALVTASEHVEFSRSSCDRNTVEKISDESYYSAPDMKE